MGSFVRDRNQRMQEVPAWRAAGRTPPLPRGPYDVLLADPAWDYRGQRQHAGAGSGHSGGALYHYPTLTLEELSRIDLPSIAAADAVLYLWVTSPHFDQGLALVRAWGFRPVGIAHVWDKCAVVPSYYSLSQLELVLGAVRGSHLPERAEPKPPQLVRVPRGRHSAKPSEVRDLISARYPAARKLELFARESAPGWDAWGLEAPRALDSAAAIAT